MAVWSVLIWYSWLSFWPVLHQRRRNVLIQNQCLFYLNRWIRWATLKVRLHFDMHLHETLTFCVPDNCVGRSHDLGRPKWCASVQVPKNINKIHFKPKFKGQTNMLFVLLVAGPSHQPTWEQIHVLGRPKLYLHYTHMLNFIENQTIVLIVDAKVQKWLKALMWRPRLARLYWSLPGRHIRPF